MIVIKCTQQMSAPISAHSFLSAPTQWNRVFIVIFFFYQTKHSLTQSLPFDIHKTRIHTHTTGTSKSQWHQCLQSIKKRIVQLIFLPSKNQNWIPLLLVGVFFFLLSIVSPRIARCCVYFWSQFFFSHFEFFARQQRKNCLRKINKFLLTDRMLKTTWIERVFIHSFFCV